MRWRVALAQQADVCSMCSCEYRFLALTGLLSLEGRPRTVYLNREGSL
jgi:hypothetical protein